MPVAEQPPFVDAASRVSGTLGVEVESRRAAGGRDRFRGMAGVGGKWLSCERRPPRVTRLGVGGERTITLVNRTRVTIWPAAWPGAVSGRTGWILPAGRSISITVRDSWNARLWGRTGCHFDASGRGRCLTGDCGGRYQCRGWGQIPATLAEYDLDSYDQLDFYDVSMVDGSNLPMYITITHGRADRRITASGCEPGHGCTSTVKCPDALQVHRGGRLVGCISPCARFQTDRYCCRGRYSQGARPRGRGRSTTPGCSNARSRTRTRGRAITRPACSRVLDSAATQSRSE